MSVFLKKLNRKISRFLGEDTHHIEENSEIKVDDLFSSPTLSSFLPYEVYDKNNEIFINKKSLGFAIEMFPLVGSDIAAQKNINSIFDEILEEGESIQCLLWTDHRIDPFLEFWAQPRKRMGGIYAKIACKRIDAIRNHSQFFPSLFRFILSYTIPFNGDIQTNELLIQKLKI